MIVMIWFAGENDDEAGSGEGYLPMAPSTCTPVMSNPEYFGDDFQGDMGVPDDPVSFEAGGTPRRQLPGNHDNYYNYQPPPQRPALSRSLALDRQSSQVWLLTD